ncbi:pyrimidine reductase family protein [Pseudonocardia bannensis]|uniref:Pyrimidine reductase family protein n=1 Tax=Pseudonocardia bannensis TaxID=630973 RepID=A0A848DQL8_9PSEU|nr:pyrimidine reductase family protein [Pseudonocardia bannensis]NMH94736.1 pyrimidine reductase family protein [Pseudonocardia bannensis]
MRRLWPTPGTDTGGEIDDAALAAAYAYPDDLTAPYVRVNFVSSLDGAVSVDGRSGGLGSAADKRVFGLLRRLADVILVGAGTVRAENYRGARRPTDGRDTPPPIAVVTGSADLDPESRLFTDTAVPPIILTRASAPAQRRDRLAAAGGDVVVLDRLDPAGVIAELGRRGLYRVLCEGGPGLHGDLVAADAVDELCLTVAPLLTGGEAGRIAHGAPATPPRTMSLVSTLHDDDTLLLRYRRARCCGPSGPL